MINRYAQTIFEVLAASYLYYFKDKTIMTDEEYDEKAKWLAAHGRKKLNNGLDKLINWKELKTKTSLYYIRENKYPSGLKQLAIKWLSLINNCFK